MMRAREGNSDFDFLAVRFLLPFCTIVQFIRTYEQLQEVDATMHGHAS